MRRRVEPVFNMDIASEVTSGNISKSTFQNVVVRLSPTLTSPQCFLRIPEINLSVV